MDKAQKAAIVLGGLTLALGLACGICFDFGWIATGWACGCLSVTCFIAIAPAMGIIGE